ncbi:MAG: amidophosphoribosyltransferase [Acutalibacteraceae bacterium]|nr:amidophosphoribosyltransferase [Clostridia bacterium]MBQ1313020.1 amidophosphoribosyltransferase [Clostridia bacterium]MEE1291932.1 amidophosphoribosyltransferase [Acutalibacteraceae bacterium]MEE3373834.1 amidophosphoribosyltransferase [Acutalibacteraceae bacterium]NLD30176.1 amidophosphoribosyltransferase [Clostridiales bacterium]
MGGFCGVATKNDCVFDLFFGTDYHSHLGTRRAGMIVYGEKGFDRAIHNIENSPFRTKFEKDVNSMRGNLGIGVISDYEPQPLLIRSHHGPYALTTVGKINNITELADEIVKNSGAHFMEMSGGMINATELVAALINQQENLIDGIRYAQERIDGSLSLMLMTPKGIYVARDKWGRTPIFIGKKEDGYIATSESFAFLNLGYKDYRTVGPGEIDVLTPDGVTVLVKPGNKMKICTFLWVYYGYPTSEYEGVSVETMRYQCGEHMARRDGLTPDDADMVAGVPDSGTPHAVGYANESGIPFKRPFIKYTPTWPRSFMPTIQSKRDMIARMKLIPITELIENQRLVLIDDSIVRGTQLHNKTEFLKESGAAQVHVRSACPPIMFGCKYLNFSRSTSELELIARRMVQKVEGENVDRSILEQYADPSTDRYAHMLDMIREQLNFDSLAYNRLDDMIDSVGIDPDKLCTYCWNGVE